MAYLCTRQEVFDIIGTDTGLLLKDDEVMVMSDSSTVATIP